MRVRTSRGEVHLWFSLLTISALKKRVNKIIVNDKPFSHENDIRTSKTTKKSDFLNIMWNGFFDKKLDNQRNFSAKVNDWSIILLVITIV